MQRREHNHGAKIPGRAAVGMMMALIWAAPAAGQELGNKVLGTLEKRGVENIGAGFRRRIGIVPRRLAASRRQRDRHEHCAQERGRHRQILSEACRGEA